MASLRFSLQEKEIGWKAIGRLALDKWWAGVDRKVDENGKKKLRGGEPPRHLTSC